MNAFSTYNLNLLCRLCFQKNDHSFEIFNQSESIKFSKKDALSSKIMACVSIEISPNDYGPKKICTNCLQMINSWYEFKEACQSANEIFQKYLKDVEKIKSSSFTTEKPQSTEDNSISFPEISLFGYDSLLEKSVSLGSNISSILNFCFSSEKKENKADNSLKDSSHCNEKINSANLKLIENNPSILLRTVQNTSNFCESPEKNDLQLKKKGYDCDLCDKHFIFFSSLLNHDDSVHSTIWRKFSCKLCERLFISQNRLDVHVEFAHRKKQYNCSTCNKLFVSLKSLKVHNRLHTGKYKCEKCSFVSTSKLYLTQHQQKHLGADVTFDCDVCHKKFSQKSSLLRHQNLHLKNQGKSFKCSYCFLLFRSHSELLSHKSTHELNLSNAFVCNVCDKNYKSKKVLYMHSKTHEESKFVCTICEKKMNSKYRLSIHLETHSDNKTFDCFHCNKRFSFKNTLIRHVKKHFPRIRSDVNI